MSYISINGKRIELEAKQPRPTETSGRCRPVNITLNERDIARLDALKSRTGSSRSALIRCAIGALEIAIKETK